MSTDFRFVTNFSSKYLPAYQKTIATYKGPHEFKILEDTVTKELDGSLWASPFPSDLSDFWCLFDQNNLENENQS